jgi:hypothetical protein
MSREEDTTPLPPGTLIETRSLDGVADQYHEKFCKVEDSLSKYAEDYDFFVLNTLHIYLRVKQNLFDIYCNEFNVRLNPVHFELPCSLLEETIRPAIGEIVPDAGWSRYVQALPKDEFPQFQEWLLSSKWRGRDSKGRVVLYDIFEETVYMRDPVKLSTKQAVGLKERVNVTFFLPGNGSGALKLNLKNGPPYSCCYVARVNVKDHKDPFGVNLFKVLGDNMGS